MIQLNTEDIIHNIDDYFNAQLESLSIDNPIIKLGKPIIKNLLKNNIGKLSKYLNMLSKEDGTIDIEEILTDMLNTVETSDKFKVEVPILGDVEIGKGTLSVTIPYINKGLILNMDDLQLMKESLIS